MLRLRSQLSGNDRTWAGHEVKVQIVVEVCVCACEGGRVGRGGISRWLVSGSGVQRAVAERRQAHGGTGERLMPALNYVTSAHTGILSAAPRQVMSVVMATL